MYLRCLWEFLYLNTIEQDRWLIILQNQSLNPISMVLYNTFSFKEEIIYLFIFLVPQSRTAWYVACIVDSSGWGWHRSPGHCGVGPMDQPKRAQWAVWVLDLSEWTAVLADLGLVSPSSFPHSLPCYTLVQACTMYGAVPDLRVGRRVLHGLDLTGRQGFVLWAQSRLHQSSIWPAALQQTDLSDFYFGCILPTNLLPWTTVPDSSFQSTALGWWFSISFRLKVLFGKCQLFSFHSFFTNKAILPLQRAQRHQQARMF